MKKRLWMGAALLLIAAGGYAQPSRTAAPRAETGVSLWEETNGLYLRANALYDAFLVPTLGVEWRVNPCWGIKLDASGSYWGSETGKVQKIWLLSPEVRHYMGSGRRFYVGVGGNYAKYNVYPGFPVGDILSCNVGYQGSLWNAGVTVGYQLKLARSLSLDFNIGLGYTRFEYDSFHVINDVRVYKKKDRMKNCWGPTQAGISLVWKITK